MPRYAAFLRGVMPVNCRMAELKKAFEAAGFDDVATLLSSGNVVFSAPAAAASSLEKKAEAAMTKRLGRSFLTIVRPVEALRELIESDPYARFRLKPGSKKIVTFLRGKPPAGLSLPVEFEGARILTLVDGAAIGAYVRHPKAPVFMTLIENTLGKEQTTRTWDTIMRVAR